jgi:Mrp family chromosome partitioning ATPase
VSTVARQLAIAAAGLASQRVLLVDAVFDTDRTRSSDASSKAGLAEAIFDGVPLTDLVEGAELPTLFRLTAGETPLALCDWTKFETHGAELLRQIKAEFDLAIFDLPPVHGAGAVAFPVSSLDGVLLVVEAERHGQALLQKTRHLLELANANILGAVLNKQRRNGPRWLHD